MTVVALVRYTEMRALQLRAVIGSASPATRGPGPDRATAHHPAPPTLPLARAVSPFEVVLKTVSIYYGLEPEVLLSSDRHKSIARARHIAMFLCRHVTTPQLSYAEIARGFRRDHTTVMSAVKEIKAEREKTPRLDAQILELRDQLVAPLSAPRRPPPLPERFVWFERPGGRFDAVPVTPEPNKVAL